MTRMVAVAALAAALALPGAGGRPSVVASPILPSPGDRDEDDLSGPGTARLADRVTPEHEKALQAGLRYLARQQLDDGSFPSTPRAAGGTRSTADAKTAVTALATLAFLGAGCGLRHGPYHETIERGVRWLLGAQRKGVVGQEDDGYVSYTGDSMSKMHGHGFATLALAEAYGSAAIPGPGQSEGRRADPAQRQLARDLQDGIERAVTLIERSQSTSGGWGYLPGSGGTMEHEGSVTVCQVQALVAAANRGFRVSQRCVDGGRGYMRRSQNPRLGGFKYKITEDGWQTMSYALTGAGIVSLLGLGEYDRKEAIDLGIRYMLEEEPRPRMRSTRWFFYGSFYAVQAFHWVGGEKWQRFWVPLRSHLLDEQDEEGSWSDPDNRDTAANLGPVYPTAMCVLMLEVPIGYLSVFAK